MNKIHYTYQITNLLTNQYYIGKRSTYAECFELDDYFGSSKVVDAEVEKYGIDNFHMTVLEYHDTEDEAYNHEAELVTWDTVNDPLCYNLRPGGRMKDGIFGKPLIQFRLEADKCVRVSRHSDTQEAEALTGIRNQDVAGNCRGAKKSSKGRDGIWYTFRWESEVGDIDYIGPVKRIHNKGGHNTTKQKIIVNGVEYRSKADAAKKLFPEYADRTDGGQLRKEFKQLLKENGYE